MSVQAAFAFRGITKRFGPVVANEAVTFEARQGSIHGVVGENGAGKSTIMKVLYGLYQPDEGEMQVRGQTVRIASPEAAIRLGIGMVHQHFMLVPTLSIWRNVILGREPTLGRLDAASIKQKLDELQKTFGFHLDLDACIEDLPVGLQQQVEILKLLYREANILILDEPTAVLTPQEVETLFERLKTLQVTGKTIVMISHKLKEILRFTEAVTVMRRGKVIDTVATKGLSEDMLAEKIVGRHLRALPNRKAVPDAPPALEVKNLSLDIGGKNRLSDVCFSVRPGEILGIAGVEGNGQHDLAEILANVNRRYDGEVTFLGKRLRDRQTYEVKQNGLAVIPSDRHREAVILDFTVQENLLLGHHKEVRYGKKPWLSVDRCSKASEKLLEQFDVRPRNPGLPISALSGGNQQKVVVARELSEPVKFILASHPTRGVDIGAIEFIHSLIVELRDKGAAVVLISSELDEVMALADRVLVLYDGKVQGYVDRKDADERRIGLWMTGGHA